MRCHLGSGRESNKGIERTALDYVRKSGHRLPLMPKTLAVQKGRGVYEGWTAVRWETPVSDAGSLALVRLVDDGRLALTLEDTRSIPRHRWKFTFESVLAYQNILEEYRLELWERIHSDGRRYGWTITIPDSPWLATLKEHEPLIEDRAPVLVHYQIGTEDDVIDILSPHPPVIDDLGPVSDEEPIPGKSTVLLLPDDRDEVDAIIAELRPAQSDG